MKAKHSISTDNPKGAGAKPVTTTNPIAYIATELLVKGRNEPYPIWLDDIIFGSCLTAAGQSKNVCNVALNEVVGALYLYELGAGVLVAQGTPLRKAQRIIKAARHAAHGIESYLHRHPDLLHRYEEASKIESRLAYSHVALVSYKPLRKVPEHIEALRSSGDYIAYAEALRAFRLNDNSPNTPPYTEWANG